MLINFNNKRQFRSRGFTVIEMLVVIVIIAILATIVFYGYGAYRKAAIYGKGHHDIQVLEGAIKTARVNLGGKRLHEVVEVSSGYLMGACIGADGWGGSNDPPIEPKYLPKNGPCWTSYYDAIDKISNASGIDLSNLKKGDGNGNPYIINEHEGQWIDPDQADYSPCQRDVITMIMPGTAHYYEHPPPGWAEWQAVKTSNQKDPVYYGWGWRNDTIDAPETGDPYNVAVYVANVRPALEQCD